MIENNFEPHAAVTTDFQHSKEPAPPAALAVDPPRLRRCNSRRCQGRCAHLVAGRVCCNNGKNRVFAYVHNRVPYASTRLDRMLISNSVGQDENVTISTDGAGESDQAVHGTSQPMCRILDWFHIAMNFRAFNLTASTHPGLSTPDGRNSCDEIASCKWLIWHGKTFKAVVRPKLVYTAFDIVTGDSAVPGMRMAKRRPLQSTDEGANFLAQVRVHAIDEDLYPTELVFPFRPPKTIHSSKKLRIRCAGQRSPHFFPVSRETPCGIDLANAGVDAHVHDCRWGHAARGG